MTIRIAIQSKEKDDSELRCLCQGVVLVVSGNLFAVALRRASLFT
jgi:hypothetical protein